MGNITWNETKEYDVTFRRTYYQVLDKNLTPLTDNEFDDEEEAEEEARDLYFQMKRELEDEHEAVPDLPDFPDLYPEINDRPDPVEDDKEWQGILIAKITSEDCEVITETYDGYAWGDSGFDYGCLEDVAEAVDKWGGWYDTKTEIIREIDEHEYDGDDDWLNDEFRDKVNDILHIAAPDITLTLKQVRDIYRSIDQDDKSLYPDNFFPDSAWKAAAKAYVDAREKPDDTEDRGTSKRRDQLRRVNQTRLEQLRIVNSDFAKSTLQLSKVVSRTDADGFVRMYYRASNGLLVSLALTIDSTESDPAIYDGDNVVRGTKEAWDAWCEYHDKIKEVRRFAKRRHREELQLAGKLLQKSERLQAEISDRVAKKKSARQDKRRQAYLEFSEIIERESRERKSSVLHLRWSIGEQREQK